MNWQLKNGLLFAIGTMIGGPFVAAIVWQNAPPPVDDSSFGKVRLGMERHEVNKILRSRGEAVYPVGWPRTLGAMPDWRQKVSAWGNPNDDTEIDWFLWQVADNHQWVAVGFIEDGCGGSLGHLSAVIKKSGLRDNLVRGEKPQPPK